MGCGPAPPPAWSPQPTSGLVTLLALWPLLTPRTPEKKGLQGFTRVWGGGEEWQGVKWDLSALIALLQPLPSCPLKLCY